MNLIDLHTVPQEKPRETEEIELPPDGMSIDLLRAVYRNPDIPLPVRIRCAVASLPFETPKLMVTAQVNEQDFASLLDARIKRFEEMRAIEAQAKPVKAKPIEAPLIEAPKLEAPRPISRTLDRRFRRL